MTARFLPVALLLAGANCAPNPTPTERSTAPITNGQADDGHPGVVALLFDEQAPRCTGVLVAPRVAVTAAHCVTPDAPRLVYFGAQPPDGETVAVLLGLAHPAYDPVTLFNDVGLILLAAPAPAAATPIPILPRLEPSHAGRQVELVGFGTWQPDAPDLNPGKLHGTATISAQGDRDFTLSGAPSLPCFGDSGAPVLLDHAGGEVVAGIVSGGDGGCAQFAVAMRADVHEPGFLSPFIQAALGGVATGGRCYHDEQCSGGPCLAARDEPHLSFCASPCADDADCSAGLECASFAGDAMCVHPLPSPSALGFACADETDCLSGWCAAPSAEADSVCTRLCFSVLSPACPEGFDCAVEPGGSGKEACFPRHVGGCGVAGPAGGASTAALLLLLLVRIVLVQRSRARSRAFSGVHVL